jgi:SpoVK/Ycf46/Vps4 family AAA+-type ATPase
MSSAQKGSLLRRLEFKIGDLVSEIKASGKVPTTALTLERVQKLPEYNRIARNLLSTNVNAYFEKYISSPEEKKEPSSDLKPEDSVKKGENAAQNAREIKDPKIGPHESNLKKRRKNIGGWDATDDAFINDLVKKKLLTKTTTNSDFINNTPELEDLGALENVLPIIEKIIYSPIKNYELFKKLNCMPPRGVLLTGKELKLV